MSEMKSRVVNPVLVDIDGDVPNLQIEQNETKENFRKMMNELKDDPMFYNLPVPLWYKEENKELYGEKQGREQMNFEYAVKSATIESPDERAKMFVERIQKVQNENSISLFSNTIVNGENRRSENKESNVAVEETKETH